MLVSLTFKVFSGSPILLQMKLVRPSHKSTWLILLGPLIFLEDCCCAQTPQ